MGNVDDDELEIRLEAYCDYVDSLVERSDSGGYRFEPTDDFVRSVGGNFVFGRNYLLPNDLDYHQLTRNDLIKISKHLSDAIINPSAAITTTFDHFGYWGWTASIAGKFFQEVDDERVDLLKSDFQNTIHLGLLPIRTEMSTDNPTIDAIHADSERLALISALSVLEGFICHLGDCLTPEGIARRRIETSWKPNKSDGTIRVIGNGSEVNNYHDILQIWLNYDSGEKTSTVLAEINDMGRYEEDVVDWKFEDAIDVIQRERKDGTQNFLAILSKHRNLNLHGQTSTHALAPLALTLCCLYVWDSMSDREYRNHSEDVIKSIQMRNQTFTEKIHPLWPAAFYPL